MSVRSLLSLQHKNCLPALSERQVELCMWNCIESIGNRARCVSHNLRSYSVKVQNCLPGA